MRGYVFLERARLGKDRLSKLENFTATTDFFGLREWLLNLTSQSNSGIMLVATIWGQYDGLAIIDTDLRHDPHFPDEALLFRILLDKLCDEEYVSDSNTMVAIDFDRGNFFLQGRLFAVLAIDTFTGASLLVVDRLRKAMLEPKTPIMSVDGVLGDHDIIMLVSRPIAMQDYIDFLKEVVNVIPEITKTRTMFIVSPDLEMDDLADGMGI